MTSLVWPLFRWFCGADCILQVQGGFGNQMFQYAFALAYAQKHKKRIALDPLDCASQHYGWEVEKAFRLDHGLPIIGNLTGKVIKRLIRRYENVSGFVLNAGPVISYQPDMMKNVHRGIIRGYFPSYKYFEDCEKAVRDNFVFRDAAKCNESLCREILNSQSVAVHVRRGDYLETSNAAYFSGICTRAYYEEALRVMRKFIPEARFFVFSDDPEWCRTAFRGNEFRLVEDNQGKKSWMDMYYMSLCRNSIIANSSFSWWGMWLGDKRGRKCIGPDRLLNPGFVETRIEDFLPKNVTRISPLGSVSYWAEDWHPLASAQH